MIKKRTDHAFGKKVFLLGRYKSGEDFWLEEAKFDCGWYWGFGYIETYQKNRSPSKARDISSHSHWDGLVGQQEIYDSEKQVWKKGKYIHHLNEHPEVEDTVLTDAESWELAELMKTFYTLKEAAAVFRRGGSHVATVEKEKEIVTRKEWTDEINQKILPALFTEIYDLLSK